MSDYSQISGEHIVSLFRDHARQYGPNHVTTKDCEAELLRRLAANARPEQVTMTAREFVQWWYDGYPINHDPILIVADPDFYTKHLTPQQDGDE